jgi:hypothetical protein
MILAITSMLFIFNGSLFAAGCALSDTKQESYSDNYETVSTELKNDIELATLRYENMKEMADVMKDLSKDNQKNLEIYNQINSKLVEAKEYYYSVLNYAKRTKDTMETSIDDGSSAVITTERHSINTTYLSLEKDSLKSLEELFQDFTKLYCTANFPDGAPQICVVSTRTPPKSPAVIENIQNTTTDIINNTIINTINNIPTNTCVPTYDPNTHTMTTCP